MLYNFSNKKMQGAVSLFIVIFATLLLSVITVSATRIMVAGQEESTSSDLSQSAYDSAQAGVEDAKRAILKKTTDCAAGNSSSCNNDTKYINSDICNEAINKILGTNLTDGEVIIDSNAGQAYSCTKVTSNTPDYQNAIKKDQTQLISLKGVGSFDSIKIDWYNSVDLSSSNALNVTAQSGGLLYGGWEATTPPVLNTQLVQSSNSFRLSDFDSSSAYASSLLLVPSSSSALTSISFASDARGSVKNVNRVQCSTNLLNKNGYACSISLSIPKIGNGAQIGESLLRLTAFYSSAHYKISLYSGGSVVDFDGVQPEVDSTGRAGTLYRRVKARVELGGNLGFTYPDSAVSIKGNLCKNFFVTTNSVDASAQGNCN